MASRVMGAYLEGSDWDLRVCQAPVVSGNLEFENMSLWLGFLRALHGPDDGGQSGLKQYQTMEIVRMKTRSANNDLHTMIWCISCTLFWECRLTVSSWFSNNEPTHPSLAMVWLRVCLF